MRLVDVHSHLEDSRFDSDLDDVIERFKSAGGKFVISSGTDSKRNRRVFDLSKKYDCVKCSFGMYPTEYNSDVDSELAWIEKNKDSCVAVGEIGLDFSQGREDFEQQKELFIKMLNLAKKINKPVVIHSRKAELEVIEILEQFGVERVIMHCFCGKRGLVRRCVENGWFFSVPPVIKRWDNFKMLVRIVPVENLLTETDSPYLGPSSKERNEPANVSVSIEEIARIKGIFKEEVAKKIFNNFEKMFGR